MYKLCLSSFFFLLLCSSLIAQDKADIKSSKGGNDPKITINALDEKLHKGEISVSAILTDTMYMSLHSLPDFRSMIRENAKAEPIKLSADNEPGLPATIFGHLMDKTNQPIADALVYLYQTSDKGWYSDTAAHILKNEGDMLHARLFGYVKTDQDGNFEVQTIRPKGYPKSDLPAHIHVAFWDQNSDPMYGGPGELLFAEDERLTADSRKDVIKRGDLIASNMGTKDNLIYRYTITIWGK